MNPVKQNLIKAKALITDPRHWVQGHYDTDTGCFCAAGALMRVYGKGWVNSEELKILDRTARKLKRAANGTESFNDHPKTTHAEVLGLFDAAIEDA